MSKKIDPATPGRIDLLRGHPSTSLLATKAIAAAAAEVVGSDDSPYLYPHSYTGDRHPLHYGPDLGNRKVRDEIGRWVTEKYAIEETVSGLVDFEEVLMTQLSESDSDQMLRTSFPHLGTE